MHRCRTAPGVTKVLAAIETSNDEIPYRSSKLDLNCDPARIEPSP
jgi:hypothetical protein